MKKLIIMLAAVCAVGIAQAAAVDWSINLGKTDYANKQYYVFAGSDTSLFMVVLNDALAAGTTFIYDTMDVSGQVYTPPATSPGVFEAVNSNFTQAGTVVAAPEPTSGLLMLVGLGALALRRRKA